MIMNSDLMTDQPVRVICNKKKNSILTWISLNDMLTNKIICFEQLGPIYLNCSYLW